MNLSRFEKKVKEILLTVPSEYNTEKDMETYNIEITVVGTHVSFDFDPKMPFLLADEIKKVVKEFYKEEQ